MTESESCASVRAVARAGLEAAAVDAVLRGGGADPPEPLLTPPPPLGGSAAKTTKFPRDPDEPPFASLTHEKSASMLPAGGAHGRARVDSDILDENRAAAREPPRAALRRQRGTFAGLCWCKLRERTHLWRGCMPSLSTAVRSARRLRNAVSAGTFPRYAAQCTAVQPRMSTASRGAPRSRSSSRAR